MPHRGPATGAHGQGGLFHGRIDRGQHPADDHIADGGEGERLGQKYPQEAIDIAGALKQTGAALGYQQPGRAQKIHEPVVDHAGPPEDENQGHPHHERRGDDRQDVKNLDQVADPCGRPDGVQRKGEAEEGRGQTH